MTPAAIEKIRKLAKEIKFYGGHVPIVLLAEVTVVLADAVLDLRREVEELQRYKADITENPD
jgi:hypothetical protein